MVIYIDLYINIFGISLQRSLIYPLSLGFVVTALSILNGGYKPSYITVGAAIVKMFGFI